jgi:hypothetical protein
MVIHVSFKKKEHVERMLLLIGAVCVARLHIATVLCFVSVFICFPRGKALQRFFESACARGATAHVRRCAFLHNVESRTSCFGSNLSMLRVTSVEQ